jgi:FtsP/CotA-like multicopper oxidase with cupredoxin domain
MGGVKTTRRTFLNWCAGTGASLLPSGVLLSLSGCGGGSDPEAPQPSEAPRPFADIPVLDNPASAAISIQARRVEWTAGKSPAGVNAWVSVTGESEAPGGVLANHLAPTFNVRRGTPGTSTGSNSIPASATQPTVLAAPPTHVAPSLNMCGNVTTQSDVGLVTHLHGARVQAGSDGWPLAPMSFSGNAYGFPVAKQFAYPNAQRSTMLWYHDHAYDRTGRHVYAGLAGVYCIRDEADDAILGLVGGSAQELLCVIQDRILAAHDTEIDYAAGIPTEAPLARPEFLGSTLFVNGHPTPDLKLGRRAWRLRILNGSNARTYALALCDPDAIVAKSGQVWNTQCLRMIGADGGLLGTSVSPLTTDVLVVAPGQRRDVLLDLSGLLSSVSRVHLVTLALKPFVRVNSVTAEGIYTTFADTVLTPADSRYQAADADLYAVLEQPLAVVMRMGLEPAAASGQPSAPPVAPSAALVDAVLARAANDDDFIWDGARFGPSAGVPFGPNRLVLLMSNTEGLRRDQAVNGIDGWSDVQIFEMQAGGSDWELPFDVDLGTAASPRPGEASGAQRYGLARRSFFARERNPDITAANAYPDLHAPTIRARAGTYERWYVANVGNTQPLTSTSGRPPDMHPFHVHLVNFVVTRRWRLDDSAPGRFVPLPPSSLELDGIARQDTATIPSNQIFELLVHIPPGYSGDYVYHCHLLEHEDMCMMSHFHVD